MKRKIEFHPLAELEIAEAAAFYDARSEALGDHFIALIHAAIEQVRKFPNAAVLIEERVRRKVLTEPFPFSVLYAFTDTVLFVVAVAHHRRHPDYWKDRIKDIPG